jgi:hypothetical protein
MYLVLVEFEPEKESKAQSLLVPVCPCRTPVLGLRFFSDQFLVFLTDEDRRGIDITGFGFFDVRKIDDLVFVTYHGF